MGMGSGRARSADDAGNPLPERVVIVEDRAHEALGHFPVRFAALARAFDELGVAVDVVTSRGWAGDEDPGPIPFRLHRYGPIARRVDHLAGLSRERGGPVARRVGELLRAFAIVGAARAVRARVGRRAPVVVTSYECDPVAAALAAGPGAWLLYQFHPPPARGAGVVGGIDRAVTALARVMGRARRRSRVMLALPSAAWLDKWRAHVPSLDAVVLPLAGCAAREPLADARRRLDLPVDDRVALYFGAAHPDKDSEVVRHAFDALPDWRLLVVGDVAREFRGWQTRAGTAPILLEGRADAETCAVAHAAADVTVLSFRPDHRRGSGTLMDAISWGLPVVCSARSAAGDTVQAFELGTVFEPGDPADLARAVRAAPRNLAPDALARARDAHSNTAIARRCLDLLTS